MAEASLLEGRGGDDSGLTLADSSDMLIEEIEPDSSSSI
jgi:hypothetical protein